MGRDEQKRAKMAYVFDEARERETLVSRKGPDLTARRGNTSDCADHG